MRLAFTRAARRDLEDIIDYIALDKPKAAEGVFHTIAQAAERLTLFPELGQVGRLPNTRELTISGTPYMIAYQVAAETVTVLAVFHGARDLSRALAERRQDGRQQ